MRWSSDRQRPAQFAQFAQFAPSSDIPDKSAWGQ